MTRKLIVVVISAVLLGVLAQAQSLGDVAKQKPAKKAARVVTNDDIPSRPVEEPKPAADSPKAGDAGDTAKPDSDKPKEGEEAKADDAKDNAEEDSPEVAALKKKLADLKDGIASRTKRTDAYREQLKTETDDARFKMQSDILAAMELDLKRLDKEKQDMENELAKLKDKQKPAASQDGQ